ncbi:MULTISPECIES: AfsR/SARP family transcriptional regulator [unclassified Streptomyces]|uniref:AfsR/SARP family transcriptional regulator n=1 Tax=unclassified Streptomyces TaxID=2593676 RepID=UPI0022575F52|nr:MULTISPECIES: AfsR/SARP family transcriptional regulator [unclassified Streptomyces]WSP53279.1 AfsR/SARP family transcriptional regulator [Streptomyces sp. NBC_01241]WSU26041.1 AfsR/SARP family transcriptional regulator [Streptomyces sp. NBC_01108]MCX4792040.1 AfsR/SARP family transcriptional regulator [Streptomyces sp. NBC_01221]MCX4799718.1 AfsR/SARP family transcriptional regulator [Streptomyces sp. NBC_01242]WSJ40567.1 AfsR/SARP family transcriptional regulator [Streptomyces sp. NBC_013
MEITILGPLTVIGKSRLPVGGTKVRAILALLALNAGSVVSCQDLADELWDDCPPRTTKNTLQAHIARLRRLLEGAGRPDALQTVSQGYLLDLSPDAIDAERFHRLASSGAQRVADHPQAAVEHLEQALRLWRGPALLDAGPGARCRSAALWLNDSRVAAHENLMAARLALGDERAVASELESLAAQHPLREGLHDLLMLALYRADRQADAIEVFHRLRQRLRDDLGLQPGLQVQRRYRAILDQDPALTTPLRAA